MLHRRTLVFTTFLMTFGCSATVPYETAVPPSTIRWVLDAVAVIGADLSVGSQCTAVFVSGQRIVTAAHCIRGPVTEVSTADDYYRDPRIVMSYGCAHIDPAQDIAILVPLATYHRPHGALRVAAAAPEMGDPVAKIGHGGGMIFSAGAGIVSSPMRHQYGGDWMQSDIPVWFGDSGSPVVDRDGALVGITSHFVQVSHLSFFVHRDRIADALSGEMECEL